MAATLPCLTLISPLTRKSRGRVRVPATPTAAAAHFSTLISSSTIRAAILPLAAKEYGKKQRGFCVKRGLPRPAVPRCAKVPSDPGEEELVKAFAAAFEEETAHMHAKEIVNNFYSFINAKKVDELRGLISEDCYFEELSFPEPFHGRQEVMHFLGELVNGMGEHIVFVIDKEMEGDDKSTAGLMWHLEWKKKTIPFTRGCSFYECSRNKGGELLIHKARVVIESPLKPGVFVLRLLRVVSSIFDRFPQITERFLLKPHVVFKIIAKFYALFVEPMILPLLVYYTHLWTFAARLIGFLVKIVTLIAKCFK